MYKPRGASPSNLDYNDGPLTKSHLDYQESQYNQQPININLRSALLEQCNNQYEENFRNQHQQQQWPKQERNDNSKERSGYYPSPYAKNTSISPNRGFGGDDDVEETIQGSIDGNMTAEQIRNKKAYVWAFGKNQEGELALGVYKDALLPRFVTGLKGLSAKWISSSNHHTALITQDGQLLVSGSSLHGKLGIENLNKTNINKFQIVPALQRKKAKQVACGDYHTLCLMEDGTVYQFGGSTFKDKKDKIQRPQSQQPNVPPNVPYPVQALYGKDIIQIDCGDFHSAALDANGDLYTWGGGAPSYNKGQCGHGHTNSIEQPEKVKYLSSKRIIQIACGGFHTLALTSENELYAFGSGSYGECGYGEYYDTAKPKLVKFPFDQVEDPNQMDGGYDDEGNDQEQVLGMYLKEQPMIVQIAAGGRHSLVLTNKGRLYSFGYGSNGQLGLRNTSNYAKPHLVKDLIGKPIVQMAAGWNHSLVMTDRGDLYACGYGGHGQLGLGDKQSKTQFTFVASLGNKNISRIFAGGSHSWVILDQVVPIREKWSMPSPLQQPLQDRSLSNTPIRPFNNFGGTSALKTSLINSNSASKGRNSNANVSPFQQRPSLNNENNKFTMSSATFGNNNMSFNKPNPQPSMNQERTLNASNTSLIPQGDDFIQKVIEIQHQQLMKAQYFLQVTYCETEYCHRFVNFEVHGQFIKQFESLLEEYIQQSYQLEKGVMYHKVQEVPQEFYSGKNQNKMTPGERMIKETMNDRFSVGESRDFSDLDESFTPEEGHKGYTLCLICNPNLCGYDEAFNDWKRDNGLVGKAKRILVNSSSLQGTASGIKAVAGDENQAPLIGKIVFIKDTDIDNNQFEDVMSKWMSNFHRKLAKYCIKKPRYSELRPMKFSLT